MNATLLEDKYILLGITGGIAAYKSCSLLSKLVKAGAEVEVIMTESAEKMVGRTTFESLSKNPVHTGTFDAYSGGEIKHVELARKADLVAVVPATLNTIGKIANGIADNLLTTTVPATTSPVLLCPSMEHRMYESSANQKNLEMLRQQGYHILKPVSGRLASGRKGKGRLPEPKDIFEEIERILGEGNLLKGKRVVVTAGPTYEPIDPMRVISNKSSGRMGYALAEQAQAMGGEVLLVTGPTQLSPPSGVGVVTFETAKDLEKILLEESDNYDLLLMAAAVSDWEPADVSEDKVKKEQTKEMELQLTATPDVLKQLGKKKHETQILVGFAAESEDLEENAQKKLRSKNLNAIFANPLLSEGIGPNSNINGGTLLLKSGARKEFPPQSKSKLARGILKEIASRYFPS